MDWTELDRTESNRSGQDQRSFLLMEVFSVSCADADLIAGRSTRLLRSGQLMVFLCEERRSGRNHITGGRSRLQGKKKIENQKTVFSFQRGKMFPGKHLTGSLRAATGGQGGHAGSAHSAADSNGSSKPQSDVTTVWQQKTTSRCRFTELGGDRCEELPTSCWVYCILSLSRSLLVLHTVM